MKKRLGKKLGFASFCLFFLCALSVGIPVDTMGADTFKIAMIETLSGGFEYFGRTYLACLKFAADEQNEKGGLLGKKIEVITEDNEGKPDVALRKAKKVILVDKVDLLAGSASTIATVAITKAATEYKKIHHNYGSFTNSITGKVFSRYSFRTCATSAAYTSALAQVISTKPYRRFYVICPDYSYGHEITDQFKQQLKLYLPAAQIVGEDYFPMLVTKDFAPFINKVIAAKADAIFTGAWGPDASYLIKQARTLGLKVPFPFLCPSVGMDPYLANDLKDNTVGVYAAGPYDMNVKTPENEAMLVRWHAKHKNDKDFLNWWPSFNSGYAVPAWHHVFAAIEKAGSSDSEKIIQAFEGMWHKSIVGWRSMRKCDHTAILPMFAGPVHAENPWFNGSIRPDVKFPWTGPDMKMFPAMEASIPPTPDYNPRCP
jgi:branched-chain amino acid transport system substrate-binding protein